MEKYKTWKYLGINLCNTTYKEFFENFYPNCTYNYDSESITLDGIEYFITLVDVENFDEIRIVELSYVIGDTEEDDLNKIENSLIRKKYMGRTFRAKPTQYGKCLWEDRVRFVNIGNYICTDGSVDKIIRISGATNTRELDDTLYGINKPLYRITEIDFLN